MGILDKFLDAVKVNDDYDDDAFLDDVDDDFEEEKPKKRFFKKMDDFDDDDDFDDIPVSKTQKKAEKQSAATKAPKTSRSTAGSSAGKSSGKVTSMYNNVNKNKSTSGEVCVMKPKRFDEATEVVDALLDKCTVILNLEGLDMELAQHIIDFTSGASYSLDGSIRRVSAYIFILTPSGVDITGESQDFLNDMVGSFY